MLDGSTRKQGLRRIALAAGSACAISGTAFAAPLAPGDLLISCAYWGVTRIEAATGEQHPIGVGNGGGWSTVAEDAQGLVWTIDNRWVVSIDPETGEHRLILQLPNDFDGSNNGELLPEPEGTVLYAGDGEISRIDPADGSITPVVTGPPLVRPISIDYATNGDLLILDAGAGAVFRWNDVAGVSTVASGNLIVGPKRVRQLADGDLLVLRGSPGRPVRVDPDDGAQSLYSNTIGSVTSAAIASNGDLIYANTTGISNAAVSRLTSPTAEPIPLLNLGQTELILNAEHLALTADDRVLIGGMHQEFTDGVVTDSAGAYWIFDPTDSSLRVLSRRPMPGGIATGDDGRLFVANSAGTGGNLREVNPRTGETRRAGGGALYSRPFDAAVEADGRVVVVNGTPNGIASVLRVDPDTGDTVVLSPTDQMIDPEKIAVAPNGDIFVSDFQVGLVRIDPEDGAQSVVPDSGTLSFNDDIEVEASGFLRVAEQGGDRMWRVDPLTGARDEIGPLIDEVAVHDEPQGYGGSSSLALELDGTAVLSLVADSGPNGSALFRAPAGALAAALVSELPLCHGDDLEVVKALPAPEPVAAASACAALAGLALRAWRRRAR